jgi:predicted RNA binding protein YcfA (HicA-like mRNA interferase family)/predicted RNase H-like HicB family nuclease
MPMKVREVIQLLEKNGWKEMRSKGSHRHFKHPEHAYLVTVPGNDGKELAPGTLNAYTKEVRFEMSLRRYSLVIEPTSTAFSPDVPGCVAVGDTAEEARRNFQDALAVHFEAMREIGEPIPEPRISVDYVEVAA